MSSPVTDAAAQPQQQNRYVRNRAPSAWQDPQDLGSGPAAPKTLLGDLDRSLIQQATHLASRWAYIGLGIIP